MLNPLIEMNRKMILQAITKLYTETVLFGNTRQKWDLLSDIFINIDAFNFVL